MEKSNHFSLQDSSYKRACKTSQIFTIQMLLDMG
jgi:hypothetical protein